MPSSQAPHLFWAEENLVAACSRCNYGGGSRVAAANKRETIARLHKIIGEQQQQQQQQQQIAHLLETVARMTETRNCTATRIVDRRGGEVEKLGADLRLRSAVEAWAALSHPLRSLTRCLSGP